MHCALKRSCAACMGLLRLRTRCCLLSPFEAQRSRLQDGQGVAGGAPLRPQGQRRRRARPWRARRRRPRRNRCDMRVV